MLIHNYDYLNVSFFFDKIEKVKSSVSQVYKNSLSKFKIKQLHSLPGNLKELGFINPISGGAHKPMFYIWNNLEHQNLTFFISNYEDGLVNLTKNIAEKSRCELVDIALSNDLKFPKYLFRKVLLDGNQRYIQLIKDSKREFSESGPSLPYEKLVEGHKSSFKDNFSNQIIISLLEYEGIDLKYLFTKNDEGYSFERIEW